MKPVALITGGSSGLGKEIARALQATHTLVLLDRDRVELAKTCRALHCEAAVCDISKESEVRRAVSAALKRHGRIDALVNNAGVFTQGPIEAADPEEMKRVLSVNVLGTMLMTRAVVPGMKRRGAGTVVNVVSRVAFRGSADRSVYYGSKWALRGFTECLEKELSPHGIRVTGVYPDQMKTRLFARAGHPRRLTHALEPEHVASVIACILSLPAHVVVPSVAFKHIDE